MEENKKNKIPNVPNLRFPKYSSEWITTKYDSVCKVFSGGTPKSSNKEYYKGDIPFIRSGEIHLDKTELFINEKALRESSAKMINKGDLLLALYGATSGEIDISRIEGAINQAILCIKTDQNKQFIKYGWESKVTKYLSTYLQGGQGNLSAEIFKSIRVDLTEKDEQAKIGYFLVLLDDRIKTQNKIIEKYESLIKQLNDDLFSREINCKIGDFIQECSKRNKDGAILNVLSVSNKNGFVKQSEQFEDKELASEDKTNYKIVQKGDFAFNPARINVGSIALLKKQETGIVSPMYICFKAKNIPNEVLESYFSSSSFKKEMNKRLEGSVRMCLTIDGMKNIRFHKPDEKEVNLLNHLTKLRDFVSINKKILVLYNSQKKYLLSNLFI